MTAYLVPLKSGQPPHLCGPKAISLHWLAGRSAAVPPAWGIPWTVFDAWRESGRLPAGLKEELARVVEPQRTYAVRSSANVEDAGERAFAGQFTSVLNAAGVEKILAAVESVYRSAGDPAIEPYLARAGLRPEDVKMGVVVQEMVTPRFAGVAFSHNPVTGLNETVVEAVAGSGEQLVQDGVTPERWVHKWGDWIEKPAEPALPPALLAEVVAQVEQLAAAYGRPADLEWVTDGQTPYWVQIRPITSLENLNIYSNRISREVLPGLIKPLVWSVNVPMINSAWVDLFTELIGPNDIDPLDLSRAFHYRAYFNMGTIGRVFTALGFPRETLELLMGLEGGEQRPTFRPSPAVVRHLPRMIRFAWDKGRFARRIDSFLPVMRRTYAEFAAMRVDPAAEAALLAEIERLISFNKQAAYVNIVGPLLAQLHNGRFHRALQKRGVDPALFDLRAGEEAFDEYDPNVHLAALCQQLQELPLEAREMAAGGDAAGLRALTAPGSDAFWTAFTQFLDRFGYMSDSGNDFSRVPWRETPGLVLQMIAGFAPAAGGGNGAPSLTWEDLVRQGRGGGRLRRLHDRARRYRLYREQISGTYTYGYGLFRSYFTALGACFTGRALLDQPEDIFYLYLDEVRERIAAGPAAAPAHDLVAGRRAEIAAAGDAVLPELIYGDDPPPLETTLPVEQDILKGVPTSRGYYQGPACVITEVGDFGRMRDGAVLVIPYSDVSWTPLFARAGAVIAEAGGMLSHSSIVAREYGLPAVVSVTNACRLLRSGDIISVDGFTGQVILHREELSANS